MKKVLVTGASGFVAEHLIPVLREQGWHVCGLDRKAKPSAICDDFKCIDLIDFKENHVSNNEFDLVIHLAAARADWGVSDDEFFRDNVDASISLINAIGHKIPKIILYPQSP